MIVPLCVWEVIGNFQGLKTAVNEDLIVAKVFENLINWHFWVNSQEVIKEGLNTIETDFVRDKDTEILGRGITTVLLENL